MTTYTSPQWINMLLPQWREYLTVLNPSSVPVAVDDDPFVVSYTADGSEQKWGLTVSAPELGDPETPFSGARFFGLEVAGTTSLPQFYESYAYSLAVLGTLGGIADWETGAFADLLDATPSFSELGVALDLNFGYLPNGASYSFSLTEYKVLVSFVEPPPPSVFWTDHNLTVEREI